MSIRLCVRLLGAVFPLWALSSCHPQKAVESAPIHYPTEVLSPVNRSVQRRYPAVLKGRQNVDIRPQCSGLITRICIEEGAYVRKGQTLFLIDRAPYEAAVQTAAAHVAQAEAHCENARLKLESKEMLYNGNVVSEYERQSAINELKEAEADLAQCRAQYRNALNELSYTEVKSPVNGVAGMIPYRVGALVDSRITEPLVRVSDMEEVFAYFAVSESDALARKVRREACPIHFQSIHKELPLFCGVIDAVSGMVDAQTGTLSLRARISNPDRLLYDGGTGTVLVSSERKDCLVVPQTATYEIQNRRFVYRFENGRAVSVAIEVEDIGNGKEYIVLSGLKAGDSILSEGAGLFKTQAR